MPALDAHGIDLATLGEMYDAWCAGATKSELERRYLDAPQSHGKLFTALVREHLGIETERQSAQRATIDELQKEVARLREILRRHGIRDDGS